MKNEELFKRIVKLMPMAWNQNSIYPGLIFDIGVPARGQCEPTVCVIQDYFGGDIYKIEGDPSIAPKKAHYYNFIDGKFIDLTHSQFTNKVPYEKGTLLTQKQADSLRTTSYCNRKVRYYCLSNRIYELERGIKTEVDNNSMLLQNNNIVNLLLDGIQFCESVPLKGIMENIPTISGLFALMQDIIYDREKDDISNVLEYLEDYLQTGDLPCDYIRAQNPLV